MSAVHRARVAGHLCIDIIPAQEAATPGPGSLVEVGPLDMRLGGCVANTGVALAALGAPVDLVAVLGDDLLSTTVEALLARSGVATVRVHRIARQHASYSVVLESPGVDRAFLHHVGVNAVFDGRAVDVDGTDLLHVGYPQLLPALLEHAGRGLTDLLDRARRAEVTTSVDFSIVDPAHAGEHPWPELVRAWAPLVDVFTPSVDDMRPAFPELTRGAGTAPAIAIADAMVEAGVGVALVTSGQLGMCLRTGGRDRLRRAGRVFGSLADAWADRQLWAPAFSVAPVRTIAAGDTATAGLLFGLLAELGVERALRLAAAAAALHISGVDPLPAWRTDSPYDHLLGLETSIEGWTPDTLGLLHGPADGAGVGPG